MPRIWHISIISDLPHNPHIQEVYEMHSEVGSTLRADFFSATEQMIDLIRIRSGRTDRILEDILVRIRNMRTLQLITFDEAKELRQKANRAMLSQ